MSIVRDFLFTLSREGRETVIGYVIGAFSLIAGLAWNDAVRSFIEYLFPLATNTVLAKFLYASGITFVVIFASVSLSTMSRQREKKNQSLPSTK